jgi:iron complex transport system substrate-binding protein
VFYQAWARPLITVSNRDLIGDAIRFCGGQNVFGQEAAAARQVDPEAVRAARPQLVVLGDGSTADAPGGESLERWRNRWIAPAPVVIAIAPDLLQRPTPRVLDGVERLCDAIRNVARNTSGHSPVAVNSSLGSGGAMQRARVEGWR